LKGTSTKGELGLYSHFAEVRLYDSSLERKKLFRGFSLRAPQLIGLDIGTTAVKAARIQRRGSRPIVTGLASAAIDQPNWESADADEKISLAVWRCLQGLRESTGVVVSGLSGSDVVVRTFDFPALPQKQLGSAVELEAAQVCPFDFNESTVTYQVLRGPSAQANARRRRREDQERTVGIFVAAKNAAIQRMHDLCKRSGAHCVVVDVDGLALLNCLEACKARKAEEKAMIVNVGSSQTNVAILSDDGLPFVRDIPYGAESIASHICSATGAARETIVGMLAGSADSHTVRTDLQPSLKEACSALADRVVETVRYHGTRQSGPALDRILLCGGLGRTGIVADALTTLLGGKVEPWNPLTTLSCARAVQKGGLVEQGAAFAVALGLAMRSLRDVHD
jgi:type IV pilus assembly protein PilM